MNPSYQLKGIQFSSLLTLVFLFFSTTAFSPYTLDSMRLIETAPGKRQWMTGSSVFKLAAKQHEEKGFCGGFFDVTDYPNERPTEIIRFYSFSNRPIREHATVQPLLDSAMAEEITGTVRSLSQFRNRYFQSPTGVQSSSWIENQFRMYAMNRSDIEIETFTHKFPQPSIIARIKGQGHLAKEKVIIGGHADSIQGWGGGPNMIAPGADDNASGIASILEAFRVIAQGGYRPERTLEFMAYAGEEVGLLGSQDIAQRYKALGESVFAVMQLDMTMFAGSGSNVIHFVMDNIDPDLTSFTQKLVREYLRLPVVNTKCGYACSDHASWTRAGYAAVFPFEASKEKMNPKIHTTSDLLGVLDAGLGLHFAKLAVAFAVELSAKE
jgi:leucyl aminopeptidase